MLVFSTFWIVQNNLNLLFKCKLQLLHVSNFDHVNSLSNFNTATLVNRCSVVAVPQFSKLVQSFLYLQIPSELWPPSPFSYLLPELWNEPCLCNIHTVKLEWRLSVSTIKGGKKLCHFSSSVFKSFLTDSRDIFMAAWSMSSSLISPSKENKRTKLVLSCS